MHFRTLWTMTNYRGETIIKLKGRCDVRYMDMTSHNSLKRKQIWDGDYLALMPPFHSTEFSMRQSNCVCTQHRWGRAAFADFKSSFRQMTRQADSLWALGGTRKEWIDAVQNTSKLNQGTSSPVKRSGDNWVCVSHRQTIPAWRKHLKKNRSCVPCVNREGKTNVFLSL